MASSRVTTVVAILFLLGTLVPDMSGSRTLANRRKALRKKLETIPKPKSSRVPAFEQDSRFHKATLDGSTNESNTSLKIPEGLLETNEIDTRIPQTKIDKDDNNRTPSHLIRKVDGKSIYNCPVDANSNGNGKALIQADPVDCSQYYYCVWGEPKIFSCSWPTLWNDDKKNCDWYYNVNCKN